MTPKGAREPYIDDAAASFNTEIFSISCGLIVFKSPSIPSIRISGLPLEPSPIVPLPRIFILAVLSTSPVLVEICNPGTNPCNAIVALATGRDSNSFAVAIPTEPVKFTFF